MTSIKYYVQQGITTTTNAQEKIIERDDFPIRRDSTRCLQNASVDIMFGRSHFKRTRSAARDDAWFAS